MENLMKSLSTIPGAVLLIATPACFAQQVVGSTKLGGANVELRDVTTGWSIRRQVLGESVFNDNGDSQFSLPRLKSTTSENPGDRRKSAQSPPARKKYEDDIHYRCFKR